jgi:hypothetical protein
MSFYKNRGLRLGARGSMSNAAFDFVERLPTGSSDFDLTFIRRFFSPLKKRPNCFALILFSTYLSHLFELYFSSPEPRVPSPVFL